VSAEGLLVRLLHAPPLRGYFELSLHNATLRVSSATVNDDIYSELLVNLGSRLNDYRSTSGVVLKKNWGTPETRLRQRFFKQFRPTYTYTHTRQKHSAVLKLSYTAFQ